MAADMSYYLLLLISLPSAILVHFLIKSIFFKSSNKNDALPSPPALPIIGHLHLMGGAPLPICFQNLARRYGPLLEIRLGASKFVLVSSSEVAKEVFKTQELNFSSKPEFGGSEFFIYGTESRFILADYGDYWRFLKKLCMTKLLSASQLNKFVDIRERETAELVESVRKCAREGKLCDLSSKLITYSNNIICSMAMSTRCSGDDHDAMDIEKMVKRISHLVTKLSLGDVLGPLKVLNFFSPGKKLARELKKYDQLVERIMKEHEMRKATNNYPEEERKKDIVDILLETSRDPTAEIKLTRNNIKSFLLEIFVAGTDTTASTLQWAMAELLNQPRAFKKLRDEINGVVGTERVVKESDVPSLPYLRAAIMETLRMHPAGIIVRAPNEDSRVNGCTVKAKSQIMVNIYAIMRDPELWTNPDVFMPERFLEGSDERIGEHQMEYKGQNFRYLPFGSGRRACPGASLAMFIMTAALGALVQCFDWKLKDGEKKVDLTIGSGIASEMAHPLVCYPVEHMSSF